MNFRSFLVRHQIRFSMEALKWRFVVEKLTFKILLNNLWNWLLCAQAFVVQSIHDTMNLINFLFIYFSVVKKLYKLCLSKYFTPLMFMLILGLQCKSLPPEINQIAWWSTSCISGMKKRRKQRNDVIREHVHVLLLLFEK